jgi:hypothetical protein
MELFLYQLHEDVRQFVSLASRSYRYAALAFFVSCCYPLLCHLYIKSEKLDLGK